jgi:SAM-dependent methyltransferase
VALTPWASYLRRFHAERPGITERILHRCRAGELDPYQWCAQPLASTRGPVMDLACGSGPMADHLPGLIGLDTSAAELGVARDRGRRALVLASAAHVPARTASFDGVVCSMGVQIIDPLDATLAEVARILRPGGTAVLLAPTGGPVPWRDAVAYGRLQVALRQHIHYPNDHLLRPDALRDRAAGVGLTVVSDEGRAFVLPLTTRADADDLLASLYLPTVTPSRLRAGRRVLLGRVGHVLVVPLRRVILARAIAVA